MLLSARGASAPVAAEMVKAREAPKEERKAPKARGGVGGHRGGSRCPLAWLIILSSGGGSWNNYDSLWG